MATTNFQQWNPATVNQETDAQYTADSQRAGGAVDDTPFPATLANKLFYQSSTFITAFGKMMAAKGYTTSDADVNVLAAVFANLLTEADQVPAIAVLAFSPTPAFNAAASSGFQMTLAGNIAASTIAGVTAGQALAFYFVQDGVGGRTVTWPAGFTGMGQPDPTPNSVSMILFRADAANIPRAIGPTVSNNGIFTPGILSAAAFTMAAGAPLGSVLIGDGTKFTARSLSIRDVTGTSAYGAAVQNTTGAEMRVLAGGFITGGSGTLSPSVGPTSAVSGGQLAFLLPTSSCTSPGASNCSVTLVVPAGWWYMITTDRLAGISRVVEFFYA